MLAYTDDPVRDAEVAALEGEKWLESRPICDICGAAITDAHYFEYENETICPGCWDAVVVENFIRFVEEDF